MSSIGTYTSSILQNTVNASQTEINTLLKQLSTGLKISSASDDPANIYVSDTLNLEALENATTSSNAQSGLTYLQIAQKAYSDIVTELNKIKDLANQALKGTYDSVQIADFQKQITDSINTIKLIESGTTFNGIQVFNNSNSAGMVNEHMFAITSKTDVVVTTATIVDNRGSDYSDYLSNDVDRYEKKDIGGSIALVNDAGNVIAFNSITISTDAQFKAIVSGMTLGIGLDKNYVLGKNFDVAAMGINTNGKALFQGNFIGTFDGAGYTISNLTINNTDASVDAYKTYYTCDSRDTTGQHGVGVFDTISGSVANLTLSNINISVVGNTNRVGALAAVATNGATIANVNVASATLTGGTDSKGMGGLVGLVDNATISDSSANASITGAWTLGGLAGAVQNGGVIKNSSASGTINCNQATAQTANYYYGGSEKDRMVGGFVGYLDGSSSIDSSKTSVAVTSSYQYTGGFAGIIAVGTVTNSFATGNVTSTALTAGGFAADIRGSASISNCYASNAVSAAGNAGGFYGQSAGPTDPASVTNSFYDSTKYAGTFGPAADSSKWVNSTGLTTAQISGHDASFAATTASWDPKVWDLSGATPTLKNVGTHASTAIAAGTVTTIENAQELISALSGTTAGKVFILLDNIDLSSLGTQTQSLIQPTFQGTLMGNGYAIKGLSINSAGNNVGLFSQLGASAKVQDLILNDFSIKGASNVGALAGNNAGALITNVAALNVNNSGQSSTGGLIGSMSSGTIEYSYATGKVSGDTVSVNIGGLLGEMNTSSSLVRYSFANVSVTGGINVGGLVGGIDTPGNAGTVTQSYARGSVTGETRVGGLVGYNSGTISNAYALGAVTGKTSSAGLVGENYGVGASVVNSYSLSNVKDSTTVYDITQFSVTPTAETNVAGSAERPNDNYSITYVATNFGTAGRVYAFSNTDDYKKFQVFDTTGTTTGEVDLFYEKDVATNTWYARKLQASYTYTPGDSTTEPDSVNTPNSTSGTFEFLYNDGSYTYAFSTQADKDAYTAPAASKKDIGLYYRLTNPTTNSWEAFKQTVAATAGYNYSSVATSAVSGDPNDTMQNFVYLSADKNYAFASVDDLNNFNNGTYKGAITKYYARQANDTWTAYSIVANPKVDSVQTAISAVPNDPDGGTYNIVQVIGSGGFAGTYAFASQTDLNNFNSGTIKGDVARYYKFDGTNWDAYYTSGTTAFLASPSGATDVAGIPNDPSGGTYNIIQAYGGVTYAFASQADFDNFNGGSNFKGAISKYYSYNASTEKWTAYSVDPQNGSVADGSTVSSMPDAAEFGSNTTYGIIRQFSPTSIYAFASETDATNFNGGSNFKGAIGKFYQLDTVTGRWNEQTVTKDMVFSNGSTDWIGCIPRDNNGVIYNIRSGDYAFSSLADQTAWANKTGNVSRYYQWDGANSVWQAYTQTLNVTSSWVVNESTGDTGTLMPDVDGYTIIADVWSDGDLYAFNTAQDLQDYQMTGMCLHAFYKSTTDGMSWHQATTVQNETKSISSGIAATGVRGEFDTNNTAATAQFSYLVGSGATFRLFFDEYQYQTWLTAGVSAHIQYFNYNSSTNTWVNAGWHYDATSETAISGGRAALNKVAVPEAGYTVQQWGPDGTGDSSSLYTPVYAFASAADQATFNNGSPTADVIYWIRQTPGPNSDVGHWTKMSFKAGITTHLDSYTYEGRIKQDPDYNASYSPGPVNPYYFKNDGEASQYANPSSATALDLYYYEDYDNDHTWSKRHVANYSVTRTALAWETAISMPNDSNFVDAQPQAAHMFHLVTDTVANGTTYSAGDYYFNGSADLQTFQSHLFDPTFDLKNEFDIKYYWGHSDQNGSWLTYRVTNKATYNLKDSITGGEPNDGTRSYLNSKPFDNNYAIKFWADPGSYGSWGADSGASFYFQSASDLQAFKDYKSGKVLNNTTPLYYYKNDGGSTTSPYKLHWINPTTFAGNPTAKGTADQKPRDSKDFTFNYSVGTAANGIGVGNYYFSSALDRTNFANVWNGTTTTAINPIYYYTYNATDDNFDFGALKSNTNYSYAADTSQSNKYQDVLSRAQNSAAYNTYLNRTTGNAAYQGTFWFANASDKATYEAVADGTAISITPFFYYQKNGSTWDLKKLSATNYTPTAIAPAQNVVSSPNAAGYETIWANPYDSNKPYAFSSISDRDAYSSYLAGGQIGNANIYYYVKTADNAWQGYHLSSTPSGPGAVTQTGLASYNTNGRPQDEGFDTISGNYAFANAADQATFNAGTPTNTIGLYYQYNTTTHIWDAKTVSASKSYSKVARADLANIAGQAERPGAEGYTYMLNIAAGANIGTYFFATDADRTNFSNFDAGTNTVTPIANFYKLDTVNKIADPVTGRMVDSWDGMSLKYNNNVGYLVGKNNSGTITNSFFGTGANSANYIGDDGVRILGNTEIASDINPISTNWSSAIWDWTSTNKPILRNTKKEGSEEIDEDNLKELEDETKYVFHIHDDYNTTNVWLNTALTSGSFTQVAPSSAPVGNDASGRPLLASMTLAGLAGKYISDFTVSDNANPSTRYSEGKDFILYTNDNGASWKMDILSSAMYGKTLKFDYAGASTTAPDQATSGFNVYLGDNKNLNVRDMSLDLAGRLNFNLTRENGAVGALDALGDTLSYMKIKQAELKGEIQVATAALSNKTAQTSTMTTAVKNIVSVDEAKAKAELAKKQLLQSKTDTILQKFYDLQTASMQTLLNTSFNNGNAYNGIYAGMRGVNNLYNKNIVDYNYKTLFDMLNSES